MAMVTNIMGAQFVQSQRLTPMNDPRVWAPAWLANKGLPGSTVALNTASLFMLRVPVPNGSPTPTYFELPMAETIVNSQTIDQTKYWIETWLSQNGIQFIPDNFQKEEPEKKKRVRMGKWGIKKEFIKG